MVGVFKRRSVISLTELLLNELPKCKKIEPLTESKFLNTLIESKYFG